MKEENYQSINANAINSWVKTGWQWGVPIDHQTYLNATNGNWSVLLTPHKAVPKSWFGDLTNQQVLGLASGGGQQIPIFTAIGAKCTVFDISKEQLKQEHLVAKRENYQVELVNGDMTKPFPFADESFDLIFHPISNCYVEDILPIWQECYRVLKKGGRLLAGFDNGVLYAFDDEGLLKYPLPYNPLKNPDYYQEALAGDWGLQFSHTIEEQIGGQLSAGFQLLDIYEDTLYDCPLADYNVPVYYATCAIKP